MNAEYLASCMAEVLHGEGWVVTPWPTLRATHRCGSVVPIDPSFVDAEAVRRPEATLKRLLDSVRCYCVQGPPEGWEEPLADPVLEALRQVNKKLDVIAARQAKMDKRLKEWR